MTARIHRFAAFELDRDGRALRLEGREIPLQPRVFDLLLSAGYLGYWLTDPESLAQSVVGLSGIPLLLGCLAILTGGWVRHQTQQPARSIPGAAWTIFGMLSGLLLAVLAGGFPIWVTFSAMM